MTDHELQLKAVALPRLELCNREIRQKRERETGFSPALFTSFAWLAV